MKDFIKNNICSIIMITMITITLGFCGFFFIRWLVTPSSHHYHVHFIDSNICLNASYVDVYKGSTFIRFEDDSYIKTGSDNVIVFVDKVCSYCGR